jgi:hypothetical protein
LQFPAPDAAGPARTASVPAKRAVHASRAVRVVRAAHARRAKHAPVLVVTDRMPGARKNEATLPRAVVKSLRHDSLQASWTFVDRVSAHALRHAGLVIYLTRADRAAARPAVLRHAKHLVVVHYNRYARAAARRAAAGCGCIAQITKLAERTEQRS